MVLSLKLGAVLAFGIPLAIAQTETGPEQPIAFSHKLHAGTKGLKCAVCHKNAGSGDSMGLPTVATCLQCHEDEKNGNPGIERLAVLAKEKREVSWQRVYQIPSYVFFSHRSHLKAGTSCEECHGEVREMVRMHRAMPVNMASCVNCHQVKGVSTDCNYYHEKVN